MDKGSKIQERNTVKIKNNTCNHICEEYIRTNLLGPKPRTIFHKISILCLCLCELSLLCLWFDSFRPSFSNSFSINLLFGLSRLQSMNFWAASQVWSLQISMLFFLKWISILNLTNFFPFFINEFIVLNNFRETI